MNPIQWWYYEVPVSHKKGAFYAFDKESNQQIEDAYLQSHQRVTLNRGYFAQPKVALTPYVVDFTKTPPIQINQTTGFERPLKRCLATDPLKIWWDRPKASPVTLTMVDQKSFTQAPISVSSTESALALTALPQRLAVWSFAASDEFPVLIQVEAPPHVSVVSTGGGPGSSTAVASSDCMLRGEGLTQTAAQEVKVEIQCHLPVVRVETNDTMNKRDEISESDARSRLITIYIPVLEPGDMRPALIYLSVPVTPLGEADTRLVDVVASYWNPVRRRMEQTNPISATVRRLCPSTYDMTETTRWLKPLRTVQVEQIRYKIPPLQTQARAEMDPKKSSAILSGALDLIFQSCVVDTPVATQLIEDLLRSLHALNSSDADLARAVQDTVNQSTRFEGEHPNPDEKEGSTTSVVSPAVATTISSVLSKSSVGLVSTSPTTSVSLSSTTSVSATYPKSIAPVSPDLTIAASIKYPKSPTASMPPKPTTSVTVTYPPVTAAALKSSLPSPPYGSSDPILTGKTVSLLSLLPPPSYSMSPPLTAATSNEKEDDNDVATMEDLAYPSSMTHVSPFTPSITTLPKSNAVVVSTLASNTPPSNPIVARGRGGHGGRSSRSHGRRGSRTSRGTAMRSRYSDRMDHS